MKADMHEGFKANKDAPQGSETEARRAGRFGIK